MGSEERRRINRATPLRPDHLPFGRRCPYRQHGLIFVVGAPRHSECYASSLRLEPEPVVPVTGPAVLLQRPSRASPREGAEAVGHSVRSGGRCGFPCSGRGAGLLSECEERWRAPTRPEAAIRQRRLRSSRRSFRPGRPDAPVPEVPGRTSRTSPLPCRVLPDRQGFGAVVYSSVHRRCGSTP
jgi:hypothetical protein